MGFPFCYEDRKKDHFILSKVMPNQLLGGGYDDANRRIGNGFVQIY